MLPENNEPEDTSDELIRDEAEQIAYVQKHLRNVHTGKHPTEQEARQALDVAYRYWTSPYSAPEQRNWALKVNPALLTVHCHN